MIIPPVIRLLGAKPNADYRGLHLLEVYEVLNDWKRFVEMVQQISPLLILGGLSEPNRVIFKSVPLNK
jgi:hypothetical protein